MIVFLFLVVLAMVYGARIEKKGDFVDRVLDKCQVNRLHGLLAIQIVLCHAYGYAPQNELLYLSNKMGVWMTSGFLFMSGYGLMYKKESDERYAKGFVCGIIKKLYIPFGIAFVIQFAAFKILGISDGNFIRILITRLLSDWFICEMTVIYILWRILFYSLREKKAIIIMFLMILCLNLAGCYFEIGTRWYAGTILFGMGIIWYRFESQIKQFFCKGYLWKLVGMGCLWLLFSLGFVFLSGENVYLDAVWINLSTIFLWICAYAILMKCRVGNSIFDYIGTISWPIYLVHNTVLTLVGRTEIKNAFAWMVVAFAGTILFAAVVKKMETEILK